MRKLMRSAIGAVAAATLVAAGASVAFADGDDEPGDNGFEEVATDPGDVTVVTPLAPGYFGTELPHYVDLTLWIEGYRYLVEGDAVLDTVPIGPGETVIVSAEPLDGFSFPADAVTEWSFTGIPTVSYPTNVTATFYCDMTFWMTWTDGSGYAENVWLDAARGWDGTEVTSWDRIPDDATEWQAGDFVELSVIANEGYGVYPDVLPEGWRINGGGQGGFSAGYAIPFEGACTPRPTDDPTTPTDSTDGPTGPTDSTDGPTDSTDSTYSTDSTDVTTTKPASDGEQLPDTGATVTVPVIVSLLLVGAGTAVIAYRRRLALR